MGGSRMTPQAWSTYASTTATKSQQQIFTSHGLDPDFDPKNIKNGFRESCDSAANPNSLPIILATDVTGSMGMLATQVAKKALGELILQIYDRKPVTDPHVLIAAVGDGYTDNAPLQVSQFEADIVLASQVEKTWIEGNGGGNGGESYNLVWLFAAAHTKCDSQIKRKKKGYIFTVGDERTHDKVTLSMGQKVFGSNCSLEADISTADLYAMASRDWNIYHLVVEESPTAHSQKALESWRSILGENAMPLTDHTKLAEVIVSTIQVNEGANKAAVIDSWDGTTSLAVRAALENAVAKTSSGRKAVSRL